MFIVSKEAFLSALEAELKGLSKAEKTELLQDYRDHFLFGNEEGKTDEEIIASLGSPQVIAKEINANYHIGIVEDKVNAGNVFRATWAVIGLGFFNLVIVLAPFIALVALVFSGWITSIAFIGSPLLFAIDAAVFSGFRAFEFFASLLLCGIGLFIFAFMKWVTKAVLQGFIRYLSFNVSLVKGGLKNE